MMLRSSLFVALLALGACSGGGGGGTSGVVIGGTTGSGGTTGGGGVTPGSGSGFNLDTGIGGSGGIIGDIDGFGSIIMNGLELNTDDAEFYIEGESGFSQADLEEGYYVVVAGDIPGLQADAVVYRSNLKGPVSADPVVVDAAAGKYEFTVLDQTVLTTASTRFQGVLAKNILRDHLLEVSGPVDGEGRVQATYVALKPALSEYKAIGRVSNLDATAMTFDLMGLQVDYANASLSEFDGAALADGQLVEVELEASSFTAAGVVPVTEVELLPVAELQEGAEIEIEGLIDSFVSATEFTVGGLAITTDGNTRFEDGASPAQLGLNVEVEVEGTANASGVIVAAEIEIELDDAVRVVGAVTSVDVVANTVTVMDVTFQIRASTELQDGDSDVPISLNELMVGDYVEIRGYLDGASVLAVELEREADPDPGEFEARLRGLLTAFDELAGTVDIQGVTISVSDGITGYENQQEQPVDRAAFYNLLELGMEVEAEWDDFSSFPQPADQLSLEGDD